MRGGENVNIISESDFRRQLRDSALSGGYLFFGDEDYLKAFSLKSVRETICPDPSFAAFNEIVIDVLDYSAGKLLDALMPFPMMADQKLVIVRGLNFADLRPKEVDQLCETLSLLPEYEYNIVIISVPADGMDYGTLPRRPSALLNKLSELLTPVHFEKSTPAKLCGWIERHFAEEKIAIDRKTSSFLLEYCGKSMYVLKNEIDKLCAYLHAHGKNVCGEEDIRYVSIAAIELDAFAFANSIMSGRHRDALEALSLMKFRQEQPIAILGEVINVYTNLMSVRMLLREGHSPREIAATLKMHEYTAGLYAKSASSIDDAKLLRALSLCAEADASLKLSSKNYAPLEKLICAL